MIIITKQVPVDDVIWSYAQGAIDVSLGMFIVSFGPVNEHAELMTTEIYLRCIWIDERLIGKSYLIICILNKNPNFV